MRSTELQVIDASLEHQQQYGEAVFPLAFQCEPGAATLDTAKTWIARRRDTLLSQATNHGAVFFRGFPTNDVAAFDELIQSFALANFPYRRSLSNAVRINHTERVFSANEAPPSIRIFPHHEMAQTPAHPRWILFYCALASQSGGSTPICRSDILLEQLERECPAFVRACEERGLRYSNVMPGTPDEHSGMGRSWRDTLGVTTHQDAEDRLRALAYHWEWLDDDCLRATTPALPAIKALPTGRRSFFNQLIAAHQGWKDERNDPSAAVRHGDGSALDLAAVQRASELADELSFDIPWRDGDFALVDNRVVMHGRAPYQGTRKVFASLAEVEQQRFESGQ